MHLSKYLNRSPAYRYVRIEILPDRSAPRFAGRIPCVLGGNVNVFTWSSTNSWHDSVFKNVLPDDLNARLSDAEEQAGTVVYQFSSSLGRPIMHDRAVFFADHEGDMQSITHVISGTASAPEFRDL